ncbi:hypothetical protein [Rhodanobacter sp. OK091]|uniref:hypothetical protein n=1 Tax=Rhodanobacter sp. OK091 TaxID=1881037 RepID=UPI000914C6D0|nr:hypothetical protein [Rhodanobacter sp. OK091]SHL63360.1 hypothetical protein SAMN05428972_0447 [Rhodanobacter sp. OK091]
MSDTNESATFPIAPNAVRYVKLGKGGKWERESLEKGILHFGFESADPVSLQLCREGKWDEIRIGWLEDGGFAAGTATSFSNQMKTYFEDRGDTLWVTFIDDKLHYGFLEPGEPERADPTDNSDWSSFRRMRGGWRSTDALGNALIRSSLPGTITKLSMYRSTICRVSDYEYLVNRINGWRSPELENADRARSSLLEALGVLIRRLHDRDFEVLVDMAFVNAGWRRLGRVGGNEPVKDLDLEIPLTRERAYVQIKCATNQECFVSSVANYKTREHYSRLFFVYHTSSIPLVNQWDDLGVVLMDAEDVARMTLESGLSDWIIDRSR